MFLSHDFLATVLFDILYQQGDMLVKVEPRLYIWKIPLKSDRKTFAMFLQMTAGNFSIKYMYSK